MFERDFDFLLAQSVFSHAAPTQIARCLSEAKKVMKPSSIFAASFCEGEKNYTGDQWVYPGRVFYKLEFLEAEAAENGLVCVPVDWPHVCDQRWIVFTDPLNIENVNRVCGDSQKLAYLENKLRCSEQRLAKVENHPYVKLGLKIRRAIRGNQINR